MVMSAKVTVSRNRFRAWEAKSGVSDKFPHIRELCICNWPGASISILSALPTSGVCYIPFLQHLEPKMPSFLKASSNLGKASSNLGKGRIYYTDCSPHLHWSYPELSTSSLNIAWSTQVLRSIYFELTSEFQLKRVNREMAEQHLTVQLRG